jgi:hypothetical protein
MIVGLAGIIAGNGSVNPPYGQLISQSCTEVSITDANSNQYTGYYNSHKVFADGNGGYYATDEIGADSCYLPNGYTISTSTYSFDLSWDGCSNSGTLSSAGTWYYSQYADGAGGTITIDSPSSWNYSNGYYIYDNGTDCRVVLDTSMSPWYYAENYGNQPYGTKIGTPFWDSGNSAVYQEYADGMGGSYFSGWDGYPPYPTYGTQLTTPSYGCGNIVDAIEASWYLCSYTYTKADGSGGEYYESVIDGYYPYGFALSGYQNYTSDYDYSWNTYDNNYNSIFPWRYGYQIADGYGAQFTNYTIAPYLHQLSAPFYDTYGYYIYIASDGSGGYFTTSA